VTPASAPPGRGWLAPAAAAALRRARASGALRPIASAAEAIEDGGVRFQVRRLLARSAGGPGAGAAGRDPFADPEPDLVVAPVLDTHLCLLNKFPVLEGGLLVVTRAFAPQEAWLDAADWTALAVCLAEGDALAFYNAGPVAGASQAHKHLQLAPLAAFGGALPIEPWLVGAPPGPGPARLPAPPFAHAFARLDPGWLADPVAAGPHLASVGGAALAAVGVRPLATPEGPRQSAPYNLLATRSWLLAVPRARERVEDVSLNALAFAGSFVVPDAERLARVRLRGPLAMLREAAPPRERAP
jgi:ATP adenylyltransferase